MFIYLGIHKIRLQRGDRAAQMFGMLAQMFNYTGGLLIVATDAGPLCLRGSARPARCAPVIHYRVVLDGELVVFGV